MYYFQKKILKIKHYSHMKSVPLFIDLGENSQSTVSSAPCPAGHPAASLSWKGVCVLTGGS